jgi:hypothetical protein
MQIKGKSLQELKELLELKQKKAKEQQLIIKEDGKNNQDKSSKKG